MPRSYSRRSRQHRDRHDDQDRQRPGQPERPGDQPHGQRPEPARHRHGAGAALSTAKLVILAVLSAATAPWYPILQARLYGSLPGRSPVAVTLSSAAALAGGLGPLAVGLIAEAFGLSWALAVLVIVPVAVLAGTAGTAARGARE